MRLVAADAQCAAGRHADHVRRRAVEPRPRHRGGGGQAGHALHPRRQRRPARSTDRERAARRAARRRRPLRRRRARSARRRWTRAADEVRHAGEPAVRDPARRLDAARRRGVRARGRGAARADPTSRRHRPFDLVRRHAGRAGRRLRACRLRNARDRHQRRRAGGGARRPASANSARRPGDAARRRRRSLRLAPRSKWTIASSAAGYGVPTPESREAIELAARTEALFLDPTYTAKAMAGLIARVRSGAFSDARHGALLAHRRAGGAVRVSDVRCAGRSACKHD